MARRTAASCRANPDMAFGPQSQATNFFIHTTVEDWPWREGVLTMRAGRFASILAGLGLVLATFLLGRAIWPARPELALAGAAFAALLPESLFVGGAMSNDMLAAMWATLAMWLAFQHTHQLFNAVLAGTCLGLAFITKASTGSLALVVAAALLAAAWPKGTRRWPGLRALAPGALRVVLAGAAAFLIAAPWLWRNCAIVRRSVWLADGARNRRPTSGTAWAGRCGAVAGRMVAELLG